MKANPTEAKDIALYFLDAIGTERYTSAIMGRTINTAKELLRAGYTKEEICDVIDHIIAKGIQMRSLGYISTAINDALQEIKASRVSPESAQVQEELKKFYAESRKVVQEDDDTARRNREKATRFGNQSKLREKFNFDMFEE